MCLALTAAVSVSESMMVVMERRNVGDHTLCRKGTSKIAPVDATEDSHLNESSSTQVNIIKLCRRRGREVK